MVESDDEFTELCSKLLKRVKKNKPAEKEDIPKTSTAGKNKLKRSKPSVSKKVGNYGAKVTEEDIPARGENNAKNVEQNDHLYRNDTEAKSEHETHPSVSYEHFQKGGSELAAQDELIRLPNQACAKDLVLERMKQFKRVSPNRMKINSAESCDPEQNCFLSSVSDCLQSDSALAMSLQMELGEQSKSLEDEGLFFCQLCQKDLTTMNTVMREQHVNRCLDQGESLIEESRPTVPSCPVCGKSFSTEKSRASHLKRCAAKLDVPAQTLLQAVQRQATELGTEAMTSVVPSHTKRKGGPKKKEPPKKKKMVQPSSEVEELLVAMALSRSLQEDSTRPRHDNAQRAPPPTKTSVPEKKNRKKQKNVPTPLLLVQTPEVAVEKLQQRVALLLSEELEINIGEALVQSRFLDKEERERNVWSRPQQNGKLCTLWEGSKMAENKDISYYTPELNPPISPWKHPQKNPLNSQPRAVTTELPVGTPPCLASSGKQQSAETCSDGRHLPSHTQKDRQALLDLAELAGEGMTLTQWKLGDSCVLDRTGRESVDSIEPSGFVQSQRQEIYKLDNQPHLSAPLVSLAADFAEMVNNPHLSDTQLQTDCGEVLSVHMFVLYARCPLLVEAVHTEGFWVDEASTGRVRRLLLNDVSAEAALCFLRFLYSASCTIPTQCLVHVCELARRFGVASLIEVCELLASKAENAGPQDTPECETSDDDGGARAETFQQLLKSMWLDEDEDCAAELDTEEQEEGKLESEAVRERELEEIYEFAATQRKITEEQMSRDRTSNDTDFQNQNIQSEDLSVLEDRIEPALITEISSRNHTDRGTGRCVLNITPPTTSPHSILRQSSSVSDFPAALGNLKTCPSLSPLLSHSHCKLTSSSAYSSTLSSPGCSTIVSSPAHNPIVKSVLPQYPLLTSPEKETTHLPATSSVSSTSNNIVKEAEMNLSGQHTPPPLEDSYDRMFLETSGEYVEPSSVCNTECNPKLSAQTPESICNSFTAINMLSTLPQLGSSPDIQLSVAALKNSPCKDILPAENRQFSLSHLSSSRNSVDSVSFSNPTCQSTSSPFATSQDAGVILILSSDEEDEPDIKPALPPRSQQECKSSSSCIKMSPVRFSGKRSSEGYSHLDTSSSTETSWLVPATPLPHTAASFTSWFQNSHLTKAPQNTGLLCQAASFNNPNSSLLLSPKSPAHLLSSPVSAVLQLTQTTAPVPEEYASVEDKSPFSPASLTESPVSSSVYEVGDSEDESIQPDAQHSTLTTSARCQSSSQYRCLTSTQLSKSPRKSLISQISPTARLTQCAPQQPESCHSIDSKVSPAPSLIQDPPTISNVFEIEDSEDENPQTDGQLDTSGHSFQIDYEPPIPVEDDVWFNGEETPRKPVYSPRDYTPPLEKTTSEKGSLSQKSSTPLRDSPATAREGSCHEASVLQNGQLSFLNSKVWDEWEEEDDEELPVLPLLERLGKAADKQKQLKTPVSIIRKRELAPKVPITPLPAYSDMDTPVLKKELNRFGVRALPKKQMVLKLKEIFRYTHQTMSSDSEEEVPSSQVGRATAGISARIQKSPLAGKQKRLVVTKGLASSQTQQQRKPASVCITKSSVHLEKDQPLTASQESTASSSGGSDTSSLSQGSTANEFETAFADEEEPISGTQQAGREAATAEAIKLFIENHPDLHKRILLYQPIELAALQADLKQDGIKVASGKLLDFLDAHCVTFTTAAARKEKNSRGRRKARKRH